MSGTKQLTMLRRASQDRYSASLVAAYAAEHTHAVACRCIREYDAGLNLKEEEAHGVLGSSSKRKPLVATASLLRLR